MDVILKGILASNHPEHLKKQLLKKIADKGAQPHTAGTIKSVFELTINWYLENESDFAAQEGLNVLKAWIKSNLTTYEQFFSREYLIGLLSKKCLRENNIPVLIKESFQLLQPLGLNNHLPVVEAMAINYVQAHPSIIGTANFVGLLKSYKQCIPKGDFTSKFCNSMVQSVALSSPPEGRIVEYYQGSEIIFRFISLLWSQTDSNFILESLKTVFRLISDSKVDMPFCLGAIVQHIPKEMIGVVIKFAVFESKIDDDSMTMALNRIIDWLQWPTAQNVSLWINGFLQSLAAEKRFTVLISVTETKIEQVCVKSDRKHKVKIA